MLKHLANISSGRALFLLAGVLLFLGAGSAPAQASAPSGHAQHHASPFEAPGTLGEASGAPHCLLHQHGDFQTPCPHARSGSPEPAIAADCGGSPAGHVPASSVFQHNPALSELKAALTPADSWPAPIHASPHYLSPDSDTASPPPRRLSLIS